MIDEHTTYWVEAPDGRWRCQGCRFRGSLRELVLDDGVIRCPLCGSPSIEILSAKVRPQPAEERGA